MSQLICDITLETIQQGDEVFVKEGEHTYTFDLKSLVKLDSQTNPFTKNPFNIDIIHQINAFKTRHLVVVYVNIYHNLHVHTNIHYTNMFMEYGDIYIDILRQIKHLHCIAASFTMLNGRKFDYVDFYDSPTEDTLIMDIQLKTKPCEDDTFFPIRSCKLYKYCNEKDIEWAKHFIDPDYSWDIDFKHLKPNLHDLGNIMKIFQSDDYELIYTYLTNNDRTFRITHAECLYIKEKKYKSEDPSSKKIFNIIYSFIVDKYRIDEKDEFVHYKKEMEQFDIDNYYQVIPI